MTVPIDELKAALEAATPGPWRLEGDDRIVQGPDYTWVIADTTRATRGHPGGSQPPLSYEEIQSNARLIALLRNHAPALIEEVERLRRDLEAETCRGDVLRETITYERDRTKAEARRAFEEGESAMYGWEASDTARRLGGEA